MRRIGWILAVLFAFGGAASYLPAGASSDVKSEGSYWRRTRDGWQRADWLPGAAPLRSPSPHPAILGLLLLLFSSTALVGLSPSDEETHASQSGSEAGRATPQRVAGRSQASGLHALERV